MKAGCCGFFPFETKAEDYERNKKLALKIAFALMSVSVDLEELGKVHANTKINTLLSFDYQIKQLEGKTVEQAVLLLTSLNKHCDKLAASLPKATVDKIDMNLSMVELGKIAMATSFMM